MNVSVALERGSVLLYARCVSKESPRFSLIGLVVVNIRHVDLVIVRVIVVRRCRLGDLSVPADTGIGIRTRAAVVRNERAGTQLGHGGNILLSNGSGGIGILSVIDMRAAGGERRHRHNERSSRSRKSFSLHILNISFPLCGLYK